MHRGQRLTVDFGIGDEHALGNHGFFLLLLFEVDVDNRADEGDDGLVVGLGTDDEHLVAQMELCVAVGNGDVTVMLDARTDEVAVQEFVNLQDSSALQILVGDLHVHLVGLLVGLRTLLLFQLFFLLLQTDAADIPY